MITESDLLTPFRKILRDAKACISHETTRGEEDRHAPVINKNRRVINRALNHGTLSLCPDHTRQIAIQHESRVLHLLYGVRKLIAFIEERSFYCA